MYTYIICIVFISKRKYRFKLNLQKRHYFQYHLSPNNFSIFNKALLSSPFRSVYFRQCRRHTASFWKTAVYKLCKLSVT